MGGWHLISSIGKAKLYPEYGLTKEQIDVIVAASALHDIGKIAIPVSAQLVSVADVYDALINERCYKAAFSKKEAFYMIINGECGVFSPKLMEAFRAVRRQFEEFLEKIVK